MKSMLYWLGQACTAVAWLGSGTFFQKGVFWLPLAKPMGHGMHSTIWDAKPSACSIRIVGHTHPHTTHVLDKACCFQKLLLLLEACASLKAKLCGCMAKLCLDSLRVCTSKVPKAWPAPWC